MHSDPIADLLARINNGLRAGHQSIDCPHSGLKVHVLEVLEKEGFIKSHEVIKEGQFPEIRVMLKYDRKRRPLIQKIRKVSKPGLRVYAKSNELDPLRSGLGSRILTTSQGVMSDREARRKKIGGEVLCEVW